MKITWLGQLSLMIETNTTQIMIDPYLTDHLYETIGEDFRRSIPVNEKYLSFHPDMILLSHEHGDHTDIPTLKRLLDTEKRTEVLAGMNAWKKVRKAVGGNHNYVSLIAGTEWSFRDIRVRAVPAFHSDETAIGFIIYCEGKIIYITGDTLYHPLLTQEIRGTVDAMFVVINGLGNNMNYVDAARLSEEVGAVVTVPVHWGMFKKFSVDPLLFEKEMYRRNMKVWIPRAYETVGLDEIKGGNDGN